MKGNVFWILLALVVGAIVYVVTRKKAAPAATYLPGVNYSALDFLSDTDKRTLGIPVHA